MADSFGFTDTAVTVLKERYLHKDPDTGVQETIPEMFQRVADYVANVPGRDGFRFNALALRYYDMMLKRDFLPNSPTLMNAGRKGLSAQLSACYVLPIEDSMDGIFTTLKNQALIHKYGGGTGFNFSTLRYKGARVNTTNGLASGPVSFMELFDMATEKVQQGGQRRGANMGILNVDHPDILEFIKAKSSDNTRLTNFNISVGMTDEFMKKVRRHTLDAYEQLVWDTIIDSAWKSGDPGLIFFDTINRHNYAPELGPITATNPCLRGNMKVLTDRGYVPIEELAGQWVKVWNGFEWSAVEPRVTGFYMPMLRVTFSNGSVIDCTPYHKFLLHDGRRVEAKDLQEDDVIHPYKLPFIKHGNIDLRLSDCVGVRVMSVVPCEDAEEVYCLTEPKRHTFIAEGVLTGNCGESPLHAFEACNLGSINLSNFVEDPIYDIPDVKFGYFNKRYIDWQRLGYTVHLAVDFLNDVIDVNHYPLPEIEKRVKETRVIGLGVMGWADMLFKLGIDYRSDVAIELAEQVMGFIHHHGHKASNGRNRAVTCIAPTGSISLIAGCSSGIEPVFALEYDRVAFDKDEEANGASKRKVFHFVNSEYEDAVKHNDERLKHSVFCTAHDIDWYSHVSMQAAFQKYTDLAVSKTINMPNDATKKDIEDAYMEAWELGCKGITVYRDGCKGTQVLYHSSDSESREVCPECGQTSVIHEGGCKRCTNCNWSPCAI